MRKKMTTNDNIPTIIPHLFESYRIALRHELNATQLGLNAMLVKCVTLIANTPHCTANDICTTLNRDKAQIARLIKEATLKGWVKKQPSANDKRSYILTLSETGLQLNEQIKKAKQKIHAQMQLGLSEEEIAIFSRISDKIAVNLTDSAV